MTDANPNDTDVFMVREHLDNIPEFALPPGYAVRWYQPGDEHTWVALQMPFYPPEEHISLDLFRAEFSDDVAALRSRQCYLLNPDGQPIGTATAWFDDVFKTRSYSRVHWVAIQPEYQGRGLSKPLMTVILNRMKALGHTRAFLDTDRSFVAAVNLYRKFGFVEKPADTILSDYR